MRLRTNVRCISALGGAIASCLLPATPASSSPPTADTGALSSAGVVVWSPGPGAACTQAIASLRDFRASSGAGASRDAGASPAQGTGADVGERHATGPRVRPPWLSEDVSRWQSAIIGYGSIVRRDRVLPFAVDATGIAFARFLNGMHRRIHPAFGDEFLEWLDSLPPTDPRNAADLYARLEIAVDRSGRVARIGVVKTSSVLGFNLAAVEAVDKAQPFDQPPSEIVSPDGNVYMHWIFYRDERCACSPQGSRPYRLR